MKKLYLNNNWNLTSKDIHISDVTIPCCVHTDLKRNGYISDYFWRDNNKNCQWIENENWKYSCVFDTDNFLEETRLIFEGLDTYADIYLNGTLLGKTHNMFIPHSFDVTGKLKPNDNLLEVFFHSPIREVENYPLLPGAFTCERLNTRRMQCTYSWDWVDRFVTCGIFLPVYLECGNDFSVDNCYIYTEVLDTFGAMMNVTANFKNYQKSAIVTFEIIDPNEHVVYHSKQYVQEPQTRLRVNIENPELWWPNGYGAQPLYSLRIKINDQEYRQSFGIRILRVAEIFDKENSEFSTLAEIIKTNQKDILPPNDCDQSKESSSFIVLVNGKRIFCRGANWVPCEPFPSEETDQKITEIINLASEASVNMLRVWGGGWFEKDTFYEQCDRKGILVAQDFLMACGDYPQNDEWFLEELRKEASFAAKKLRNHPCLAWWNGDNENGIHGDDLQPDYSGRKAALFAIEPIINTLDPIRPFFRSSPYGGTPYMSVTCGTSHTTNFLGNILQYFTQSDCLNYKEYLECFLSRFTSEEPIYGMSPKSSLLKFMTETDLEEPQEEIINYHSKNNPYVNPSIFEHTKNFAQKVLGNFTDTEDKLFKLEYIQYEWLRVVFENCRKNIGYNDGIVFWMLNDCWPAAMSWSIIDYYNRPKAAWYGFKRLAKPVTGSLKKENGKYILYLSSDGQQGKATISCHTANENFIYSTEAQISGYGANRIELSYPENTSFAICDISFNDQTDRCFYKDEALPLHKTSALSIVEKTKNSITIKANEYIHVIQLEGDYIFSNNYLSLLKDEKICITYRPIKDNLNLEDVTIKAFTI